MAWGAGSQIDAVTKVLVEAGREAEQGARQTLQRRAARGRERRESMTSNDKKRRKREEGGVLTAAGESWASDKKSPPRRSTRGAEEGDVNAAAKGEKH